jgi:hypothetical protein
MKLELITATECPTCKSRIVAESIRSIHTCGQGFEVREFECGCILEWSPNFDRLLTSKTCPRDAAEIARRKKITDAINSLRAFIEKLDVDDLLKERLLSHYYIQPQ